LTIYAMAVVGGIGRFRALVAWLIRSTAYNMVGSMTSTPQGRRKVSGCP
jgi:hypothetical protein